MKERDVKEGFLERGVRNFKNVFKAVVDASSPCPQLPQYLNAVGKFAYQAAVAVVGTIVLYTYRRNS